MLSNPKITLIVSNESYQEFNARLEAAGDKYVPIYPDEATYYDWSCDIPTTLLIVLAYSFDVIAVGANIRFRIRGPGFNYETLDVKILFRE
jgi:hypothetical protein